MGKRQETSFEATATRVSLVSVAGNVVLSALKLLAGIFAHSAAMISDAVHSASDMLSSIIVIIGVRLSAREADSTHPYGHERLECVAAVILAVILLVTGLFIGYTIATEYNDERLREPDDVESSKGGQQGEDHQLDKERELEETGNRSEPELA